MFHHKRHSFYLNENSFGRFIEIKESYERGIRVACYKQDLRKHGAFAKLDRGIAITFIDRTI